MLPKKILAYVHAYVGHGREAGAETTLANLLESLVDAGWEAEVILSRTDVAPYTHKGVSVISEPYPSYFLEAARGADVLISHLECSERTSLVGQATSTPVVQLIHNTMWQTEGYLNVGCQLAVFNTEWVRMYHEGEGTESPMVRLVRRTSEGGRISFIPRRPRRWRSLVVHPQINPETYKTSGSHDHVTLVNLHENKGPSVFWQLARDFPEQKFLGVKGGYGFQEIPEDWPENVTLLDNQFDFREVLKHTKILLMPSTYESFGRVAIEAAANGIPTIASGTPGLEEALGPMGIFCDVSDQDAWEYRLFELLNDPQKYAVASERAYERSAYWAAAVVPETAAFVAEMEAFIRR